MRKPPAAFWSALASIVLLALAPLPAFAQGSASITGVVKDTSGAVLPGVTVEAASPVLIEKVRTVVSDGSGQYRIVDLRPGVYAVTYTLGGFSTVKRDGITLAGDFTATINVELKVGAQEETITVTGAAPTVDVQGVARQRVLSNDTIEAVPTGRNYTNLGVLIPGVSTQCAQTCGTGSQDVGGSSGDSRSTLTVHGSRFRDQRIAINGMTIAGSTGGLTMSGPNMEAMQEVQIETTSGDASTATGGVRVNVVPKDGGNTFSGSFFVTGTNEHLQANNYIQKFADAGLPENARPRLKTVYDVAPTFGGPIKRDRVWFFISGRVESNKTYVGNLFANKNAYDKTKWTYEKDETKQITHDSPLNPVGARFTWQATPRNKFTASLDLRDRCDCPNTIGGNSSVEATSDFIFRPDNVAMFTWSSPVTNRLLLQATYVMLPLGWGNRQNSGIDTSLTPVVYQNAPAGVPDNFRSSNGFNWTNYPFWNVGANATYVTGAHAFKAGLSNNWGYAHTHWTSPGGAISSIRINYATGKPNLFTVNSDPREGWVKVNGEWGAFVQDKWTIKRLTLSGGVRLDTMSQDAPSVHLGPSILLPNRDVTFPTTNFKSFKDISPRMGVAYDVFGNGKTALKVTMNRYVVDESLGSGTNRIVGSPQVYFQYTASRTWTDNGNFVPDCDMSSGAAQNNLAAGGDFCGAFTGPSANFGRNQPGDVADHDAVFGWGHRGYNWEFSTSVQQELVPGRVAADVGFFRRTYGNFTVNDNLANGPSDYKAFSVVVPDDPELPLHGQTISGFLDVNPNVASLPSDGHVRLSKHTGKEYENWQGVDVFLSARLGGGTQLQGGFSSGRQQTDNCDVLKKVPEAGVTTQGGLNSQDGLLAIAGSLAAPFCHQSQPYLTQIKGLATYTIPKIDVQLATAFQSIPGPPIKAGLVVPCGPGTAVFAQLGRACGGGSATNVTVQIVAPGSLYEDRLNQIDFRIGKIFRFGGTRRLSLSVDVFNVLNSSAILTESTSYSSFREPQSIVGARFLKFSGTVNF